ncbi:hypothetical protein ENUP19_0374G0005 [Entamoeba nuttalli]|uniref:LITAF domain containing protein n=2 Tax=Entamoeba nuttalli TaxID=412467 RepID=K2HQM3_ENTNP|nr:LITAF domain containing protein [Entamoeba nuttalli P19]EKE38220.1 LITAF domain containing protein [Entamoeba nuttalli P19]|eukprot:XP_008859445.1 LITAF domain containing protein [Entamoeba nuttalli P19]
MTDSTYQVPDAPDANQQPQEIEQQPQEIEQQPVPEVDQAPQPEPVQPTSEVQQQLVDPNAQQPTQQETAQPIENQAPQPEPVQPTSEVQQPVNQNVQQPMYAQPMYNQPMYDQSTPMGQPAQQPMYPQPTQQPMYPQPMYNQAPGYAQPSPMGQPTQQPAQQPVVIVQTQGTGASPQTQLPFGRDPQQAFCPRCNMTVTTIVRYEAGGMACLMCCIFTLLGFCCCGLIFCCMRNFKNAVHFCPNCKKRLGSKSA